MNNRLIDIAFIKNILFLSIVLCFFSCSNEESVQNLYSLNSEDSLQADSFHLPEKKLLVEPTKYSIDTMSAPSVVKVPNAKSSSSVQLWNGKSVLLESPKEVRASFYVSMQKFTTEEGLALDAISSSYVDYFGHIWFSTYGGGVSKFDGTNFTNYTAEHGLANNMVWAIFEDSQHNIWFGTDGGGLSKYDGTTFTNYTVQQGLASNHIFSIHEDDSLNLWFGTQSGGVSIFDGNSFVNYTSEQGLANNTVFSIFKDTKGNMWLATDGGGVTKFNGFQFQTYSAKDGLAEDRVKAIEEDEEGNLWFGTISNGLSKFDGEKFVNYNINDGLTDNHILNLTTDRDGFLWIGTEGGVSKFDGEHFVNFTTAQGLSNNVVPAITEDRSGNIWLGTDGGGVNKFAGRTFTNYYTDQGLPNNVVWSIVEDQNKNLWFGTDDGVAKYDGDIFTNYTSAQGLSEDVVWCITEDHNGNLWFGTYNGGINKFDGKSFTNYTVQQGLASNIIYYIYEDQNKNLWFGTHGNGVSKFDGEVFTNYSTKNGLPNDIVRTVIEDDDGNMWFGTQGGGISKFDGESFQNYTIEQGLPNEIVLSTSIDNYGNLWIGTYNGGVARFDGNSFLTFTTADGLPDNTVTQVTITDNNQISLGTNQGVGILTFFSSVKGENINAINELNNEELQVHKPHVNIYNSSTAYLIKDVNTGQNCMMLDSKGALWIGTGSDKSALVKFDLSALEDNSAPPTVFIEAVKLNEEVISWHSLSDNPYKKDSLSTPAHITEEISVYGNILTEEERYNIRKKYRTVKFNDISKFYSLPQGLILPFNHNNISFDFKAIEPINPDMVNYQFKLEGYDKNWSPILQKTNASFGNISEGTYTFKLKAQNSEGIWSDTITYSFEVLPPWYRTWWAISLYIIAIILLLFGIYRIRTASLRKDKERLEQTVKDRTYEVVLQKEEAEKQKSLVEIKNREITDSINYALRIQQAILPSHLSIKTSFPNSFILYRPKDIVSGDFYYFKKNNINNEVFIAAADCTGHGVPGALMSMVGFERINDAVEKSNDPSEILSLLNKGVKSSLHQSSKDDSTRDGMDIVFCIIDIENRKIRFAGANRPIWIIREGSGVVEEIKGTRSAIGGLTEDEREFETHELQLNKNDCIYIFSDGYPDLFSSNGKKLTIKKFRNKILEIQRMHTMEEQREFLEDFADKWMSGEEQIDDILIIGIRL